MGIPGGPLPTALPNTKSRVDFNNAMAIIDAVWPNVKTDQFIIPAGFTGPFPVTGVGFQPTDLTIQTLVDPAPDGAHFCIGRGDAVQESSHQHLEGYSATDIINLIFMAAPELVANINSLDPDGFTLNITVNVFVMETIHCNFTARKT